MTETERIEKFKHGMFCCNLAPEFVNWLKDNGFFTAPASTKYHGAYEGGLFDHSKNVVDALVKLTRENCLDWQRPESPYIIGMFHDLCKMEAYQVDNSVPYTVGEPTRWTYRDGKSQLYTGHGEKSILMLAPWVRLTAEEVACIRWHMGAFDEKENWNHYTAAIHRFNNVLWTHQADMIASHIWEVDT